MATTSNPHVPAPSSERDRNESTAAELQREGKLVAGSGVISKRTMAIAFGLVFLCVPLISASALGIWGAGVLWLLGLCMVGWGILH